MRRTPFYDKHKAFGAKLIEFGGFEMPIQYPTGIVQEHLAVRSSVGVFDVSHMGEFEIRGDNALSFLQKTTINDASKLKEGRAQYSAMCYENGGIVDDLLAYHVGDRYMLVVNAANRRKDFEWLDSHVDGGVELKDVSDETALLAIQGPKSIETLQEVADLDLTQIQSYHFVRGSIAGVPMMISRTGYTGETGFEIYFDAEPSTASHVWDAIFNAGARFGITAVGLGARDTLRLEMGYCLYGNDIDQTTLPLEAGLGWITKLGKGDFIGRSVLLDAREKGVKRKLVGIAISDKAVPRHGYELRVNGICVGHVTSGTFSPSLQKGIGMGYVSTEYVQPGEQIFVQIRGKEVAATIVDLPFLKKP